MVAAAIDLVAGLGIQEVSERLGLLSKRSKPCMTSMRKVLHVDTRSIPRVWEGVLTQ